MGNMFTRVLAALCKFLDDPHLRLRTLANNFVTALFCTAVLAAPSYDDYVHSLGSSGDITVAINVPSNGTDDLFFSFSGPSQQQWIAFGFGSQMAGSLMFIAYPAEGGGITLSPRIAKGESLPTFTSGVNVTLLNGTGITNGLYVVNAHCTGCRSWSGKTLDVSSTSSNMIYAVGPTGQSFQSNDTQTSNIKQHAVPSGYGMFTLNLQKATGDAGVPDFTSGGTNSSSGNSSDNSDENDDQLQQQDIPIVIHGIFTTFVFLFVLPGGYLFLRVFDKVIVHAAFQIMGVVGLIAGVAAGIVYNNQIKKVRQLHVHPNFSTREQSTGRELQSGP